jgi:hypothetical protein
MGEYKGVETQWTAKGFNDRFDQVLSERRATDTDFTYTATYLIVEEEHLALFGKCRYSSYESFRESRRQMIFKQS